MHLPSSRIGIGALAVLAGALAVAADESSTTIEARLQVHQAVIEALPVVVEVAGAGGDDSPRRIEAVAPGRVELVAAGSPPWTIRAMADGYWSAPQIVETPSAETLALDLYPALSLQGTTRVPDGSALPTSLTLRLQKRGDGPSSPPLEATILCPVDPKGALDCRLPRVAGLDMRLRSPGFASRFFWDLDLTASPVHRLGTVLLRPGASVVGRVEVPAGFDLGSVVARLTPAQASPYVPQTNERVERQVAAEARPDEHGLFSLEGLSAGVYRLEVSHPKLAAYELAPLQVVDGAQSEVAAPIVLAEPTPLRILLDPPFDPYGEAWHLKVYRQLGPAQTSPVLPGEELTTTAGLLEVPAAPATYEVQVFDSRGVRLATEKIVADTDGAPHVLTIEPILVEGEVSLDDEPLLARISFRGPTTVEMDADPDGQFSGYLPRPGDWDLEIRAFEPPVHRYERRVAISIPEGKDHATLELRLPDTTLRGTVVDEQGTPVPDVEVGVTDPLLTTPEVTTSTDEHGRFEMRGLDEGPVRAQAVEDRGDGGEWSSQPEIVQLREDATAEIQLVLRPHATLQGRVVAADGNPLPGVWLETQPFTAAGLFDAPSARPYASDSAGRFAISLPRSIDTIHLSVMAPGHPLTQIVTRLGDMGDVVLGLAAGSLVLDLPGKLADIHWTDTSQPLPALIGPHGIKLPVALLARWAAVNGDPWKPDDTAVTVPLVAPGHYAVCWMSPGGWMLRSATGAGCSSGELEAHGTLRLSISAVDPAPAATTTASDPASR